MPGNHLRRDPRGIALAHRSGEGDEAAGAQRDERVRAQARHLLMPLPLGANRGSRQQRRRQPRKYFGRRPNLAHRICYLQSFRRPIDAR